MYPVKFEGANINLTKPDNMTDEQCSSLWAEKNVDSNGHPYFLTAWMPNREDIESLKNGNPLYLKVLGTIFQPVAMFTVDENGEGNF